jgi:hypothetical protein
MRTINWINLQCRIKKIQCNQWFLPSLFVDSLGIFF